MKTEKFFFKNDINDQDKEPGVALRKEEEANQEETTAEKEKLELDPKKLIAEEATLLGAFRKKANGMAKVLTLTTALMLGSEFVQDAHAGTSESQKTEQIDKEQAKKEFYSLEFQDDVEAQFDIADKVSLICFLVVNDGGTESIIISSEELQRNPTLDIDGYIANIMIFGEDKMEISLNGQGSQRISKFENDDYICLDGTCVRPDRLQTDEYSEEFFQELISQQQLTADEYGSTYLSGGYFFGRAESMFYLGQAVNDSPDNILKIETDDGMYLFPINQHAFQEFELANLDDRGRGNSLVFEYLGNRPDDISRNEGINEQLQSITDAIARVESISGENLVDYVRLIDYEADNAFADQRERVVTFTVDHLEGHSVEDTRVTTEHEILHKHVYEKGFTEDPEIRAFFADLKGYTGDKKTRLVNDGHIIFDTFNNDYQNKTFFDFIDEKNFIGGGGGHSKDNIWEFCTSFIHSLMYLDRLEDNLQNIDNEERMIVLDNYINTLQVMLDNVRDLPVLGKLYDNREEDFLRNKLEYAKQLKEKLNQ